MARSPHGEADVQDEIVDVLKHGKTMTTQEIRGAVLSRLNLAPADLKRANKRQNETKIDQIIANALQPTRRICRDGLVERTGRDQFRITAAGQQHLSEHQRQV